jgi:hypothetical protein
VRSAFGYGESSCRSSRTQAPHAKVAPVALTGGAP